MFPLSYIMLAMVGSVQDISSWVRREPSSHDFLGSASLLGFQATMDWSALGPPANGIIPYLSHWLYFLPADAMRLLAEDGHPPRGGFLPPVTLPRRMWAGNRINFIQPKRVGSQVVRRSPIRDVRGKSGRFGQPLLVRNDPKRSDLAGLLACKSQDVIYREARPREYVAEATPCAPEISDFPDAKDIEGFTGLIVHGSLTETLLLNELVHRRPDLEVVSFEFRAVKPIFLPDPFFICGSAKGTMAMLF